MTPEERICRAPWRHPMLPAERLWDHPTRAPYSGSFSQGRALVRSALCDWDAILAFIEELAAK